METDPYDPVDADHPYDPYDPWSLPPAHLWMTYDGRIVDVRTADLHHMWNLLRWADRHGINLGDERRAMIVERLDYLPRWKEVWFHVRNVAYRVRHPLWRKP